MKESQIIDTAKYNFEELTHWHMIVRAPKKSYGEIDIIAEISDEKTKQKMIMMVECKNEVRNNDLAKIREQKEKHKNLIIIAQYISKPDRTFLRENNINYLESSGNCFINNKNTFIFIDNQRTQHLRQTQTSKLFTDSTMRFAYALLLEPELVNENYRTISTRAEIALGNVGTVLEALEEADLIKIKNNERTIKDPTELFETWANNYATTQRPHLLQRRMAFVDKNMPRDWKNIALKDAFWGGEPAANILDLYLNPELFTLYTLKSLQETMKAYKLIPDTKGNVLYMLPPFKKREHPKIMADPFLIYAELIQSKDSRCLEAAQRIKEKYIEPALQHI